MAMHNGGLTKLKEECGELIQAAAKKAAYPGAITHHPDGSNMNLRLEEEMADVMAAIKFVVEKFDLDMQHIMNRAQLKVETFERWDKEDE